VNTFVLQPMDITGASYSAALMGFIATSLLMFLGTGWVRGGWKLPVALCGVATLVGALSLLEARSAWLSSAQVPLVYHYVGWVISFPLQVLALFFLTRRVGSVPAALFWRFGVISVLMILVRYLGEVGFMHATLAFLIGIVFWLYILGELFFGRMDEVVAKSENRAVQQGYFWLRLIVTVGWAVYPLGNFITSFGGYVDQGGLATTYNIAGFINQMGFGLAVLATAILASKDDANG
jgi:sensory rhodopsin